VDVLVLLAVVNGRKFLKRLFRQPTGSDTFTIHNADATLRETGSQPSDLREVQEWVDQILQSCDLMDNPPFLWSMDMVHDQTGKPTLIETNVRCPGGLYRDPDILPGLCSFLAQYFTRHQPWYHHPAVDSALLGVSVLGAGMLSALVVRDALPHTGADPAPAESASLSAGTVSSVT
jgi:hypothetical protein